MEGRKKCARSANNQPSNLCMREKYAKKSANHPPLQSRHFSLIMVGSVPTKQKMGFFFIISPPFFNFSLQGSVGLLTAMLNTFGAAQFASVIESGDVFANNCVDGNRHFLEALLHHQDALSGAFDRVDLITSACFSQGTRKCDLMLLLLKEVSISGLCQDLQEVLTDLFLEILHSQEEARYRLQERLLNDEELVLGLTVENCLVPCCRLGDLQLFALLQKHVPYVVKPWLLLEDGTAAVLGAIMSDHTALLGALLELPKTDVNVDVLMDAGTPLGIATALERTEIIKKLTEAGATKKVCNLGG